MIDKLLARLMRRHRDSIQINRTRNEKEDITTVTEKTQKNHQMLIQKSILNKTKKAG